MSFTDFVLIHPLFFPQCSGKSQNNLSHLTCYTLIMHKVSHYNNICNRVWLYHHQILMWNYPILYIWLTVCVNLSSNGCFIFIEWSLLYFVQIKIIRSVQIYLFCTFFIHTYLFINYYKTIALTTGQIIAKSSCSCSIKGTGQRWGDRPASRWPASVEGTGQRWGDRPALRG